MIKITLLGLPLLLGIASCSGDAPESAPPPATSTLADSFFSAAAPASAVNISDLLTAPASGEEVIVQGKAQNFIDDLAVFTMVDLGLKSCDEMHGDACATPWDY